MKFIPNIECSPPPPPFWSKMGDLNRKISMGRPYCTRTRTRKAGKLKVLVLVLGAQTSLRNTSTRKWNRSLPLDGFRSPSSPDMSDTLLRQTSRAPVYCMGPKLPAYRKDPLVGLYSYEYGTVDCWLHLLADCPTVQYSTVLYLLYRTSTVICKSTYSYRTSTTSEPSTVLE